MPVPSNQEIKEILSKRLSSKKYVHSLGVAETAGRLAVRYGYDENKAYLAGLVHDYAKNLPVADLITMSEKERLLDDESELMMPEVLHAPVGAYLIKRELDIQDPEILQAVRCHTLGAAEMSLLDEIIYVADMIEPNRTFAELDYFHKTAFDNLSRCVIMTADNSIMYCIEKNKLLHPRSIETRNSYLEKQKR